jgi:hypothetical protein
MDEEQPHDFQASWGYFYLKDLEMTDKQNDYDFWTWRMARDREQRIILSAPSDFIQRMLEKQRERDIARQQAEPAVEAVASARSTPTTTPITERDPMAKCSFCPDKCRRQWTPDGRQYWFFFFLIRRIIESIQAPTGVRA